MTTLFLFLKRQTLDYLFDNQAFGRLGTLQYKRSKNSVL
jgi:hypothetical protein